jgi:hypothetical protein
MLAVMIAEQISTDAELCIVLSEREAHLFDKALSEMATTREAKIAGKIFFRLLRHRKGRFTLREPAGR